MGLEIDRERFEEREYHEFSQRLEDNLAALERLLARPGFGTGEASLGAELELSLIDASCRPLPLNRTVLAESMDPRLTVELDRFNLECNLRHFPLSGGAFTALEQEIRGALVEVQRAAALHGGDVAVIGILPTLESGDLQRSAMTDSARYRVLAAALQRLHDEPSRLDIRGIDERLEERCDEVTFEGAATSLQLHLRVAPDDFDDLFNAVQLATAPALAVGVNSPIFLGRRLWQETRVALFEQAVDAPKAADELHAPAARVSFGDAWLEGGALELFRQAVTVHEPLIPIRADEDPLACVEAGGLPRLEELRLHQGTVWTWNRPVYDPAAGGHLRIEMRALPAGPTAVDMAANAAFAIGLALALAKERIATRLPFLAAQRNFYRAAKFGLEALLAWPDAGGDVLQLHADELVTRLVPLARTGLHSVSVDADPLLDIVAARAASGRTGARWQCDALARLESREPRQAALRMMLARYLEHARENRPVHEWPLPTLR